MNTSDPDYKKARIGAVIAIIGSLMIYSTYPVNYPPLVGLTIIFAGLCVLAVGLVIMYIYIQKYLDKESRKNIEKVDEFVHKWERERWRKP